MSKYLPCELTTMVMLQNPETGEVLVQERTRSWKGISFPGGHVEEKESFYDCAVREIYEETGLTASNLKSCGTIHWLNTENQERYLVFLYKTNCYCGELICETEEGKNFWIDVETLTSLPSTNGFNRYLPMFFEDKYQEILGYYTQKSDEPLRYI